MMSMTDFMYEESDWAIALYEKRGRAYTEVGVFFEGAVTPADAFEMFAELVTVYPPYQAVERAVQVGESEEVETPAYEARLIKKSTNRVVSTILWDSETINLCKEDYQTRTSKSYIITAEVEIDEEDDEQEPVDWDWENLAVSGRLRVLDMIPVLEDTKGE